MFTEFSCVGTQPRCSRRRSLLRERSSWGCTDHRCRGLGPSRCASTVHRVPNPCRARRPGRPSSPAADRPASRSDAVKLACSRSSCRIGQRQRKSRRRRPGRSSPGSASAGGSRSSRSGCRNAGSSAARRSWRCSRSALRRSRRPDTRRWSPSRWRMSESRSRHVVAGFEHVRPAVLTSRNVVKRVGLLAGVDLNASLVRLGRPLRRASDLSRSAAWPAAARSRRRGPPGSP